MPVGKIGRVKSEVPRMNGWNLPSGSRFYAGEVRQLAAHAAAIHCACLSLMASSRAVVAELGFRGRDGLQSCHSASSHNRRASSPPDDGDL